MLSEVQMNAIDIIQTLFDDKKKELDKFIADLKELETTVNETEF